MHGGSRLALCITLVALLSCGRDEPARVTSRERPKPPAKKVEREVRPSPEVVALLRPDPDLEQTITPDEARATLESARARTAPAPQSKQQPLPAAPPGPDPSAEWAKLEGEKKQRIEAWQARLAATTVYLAGNDSFWYHAAGCEELYRFFFDRNRVLHRIYIGRPITLKQASDARMTAHAACAAPSYDF